MRSSSSTSTGSGGATRAQLYFIVITPAVSITTTALPDRGLNLPGYFFALSATGGTGDKIFSITEGFLPPGLILDGTGVINGTESGTQQQTTAITDDDAQPSVTLSVDNANIAESAGVATFTATLSAASGLAVTVDLGFTGTALLTNDYLRSGAQIVIPAGSTTGTGAIISDLDVMPPIYAKTAAYGHFGRDDRDFTWERTDKADALRAAAGLLEESRV